MHKGVRGISAIGIDGFLQTRIAGRREWEKSWLSFKMLSIAKSQPVYSETLLNHILYCLIPQLTLFIARFDMLPI
jgi:hypothetical protein